MNATEYSFLLTKPNVLGEKGGFVIDKIVAEFPYFQSARAMQLKYLYNQNNFKYNTALKKTAAYTTDRSVLFAFITSQDFTGIQTNFLKEKSDLINNIVVHSSEILTITSPKTAEQSKIEQSILTSIEQANPNLQQPDAAAQITKDLNFNKPISTDFEEKHSFREWLELSKYQPINRQEKAENSATFGSTPLDKKSKVAIIDKFIEANPKLNPISKGDAFSAIPQQSASDSATFMTETLAKVYLDQKKYQKAIQAYEILILKYPEKSSFFANQISNIKAIQQNNI